jgi:hypothetical protein
VNIKNSWRKQIMKQFFKKAVAAAALGLMVMAPAAVFAAGGNCGGSKGQGICKQTSSSTQTPVRQRLRDGSCLNKDAAAATNKAKRGNAYGPGDGTGNDGTGPKDGTGYGIKSTK